MKKRQYLKDLNAGSIFSFENVYYGSKVYATIIKDSYSNDLLKFNSGNPTWVKEYRITFRVIKSNDEDWMEGTVYSMEISDFDEDDKIVFHTNTEFNDFAF